MFRVQGSGPETLNLAILGYVTSSARCGVFAKLLLAAYVLAAALLPLAHHDIVCHLKSSTHCTTCVVGSSGETAGLGRWASTP